LKIVKDSNHLHIILDDIIHFNHPILEIL